MKQRVYEAFMNKNRKKIDCA